jgi:acetate---CoA ligase (ADP-forming)
MTAATEVRQEIESAAAATGLVTLASVYMDRDTRGDTAGGIAVPEFSFPEDAVRALGHAVRYSQWRQRPRGTIRSARDDQRAPARALIEQALADGKEWLSPTDLTVLFDCYRLPLVPTRAVKTATAAVGAAAELGYPVVLKAIAPGLLHKSDAGGVRVGLAGPGAVRRAAREIRRAVGASGYRVEGYAVQPMADEGIELLLGVVHDPSFGPLIACGAGGTRAELLGDVAVRITPLSDFEAADMVRSLRTFPLLAGYRGAPARDVTRRRGCAHATERDGRCTPRNRRARRSSQPAEY